MAARSTKTRAAKAAPKDTPEGASGKAREAPSAGSGDGAIEAPSGTQSAPPSPIPADQQPEHSASVGTAKPEAKPADRIDGTAAQEPTSVVASGLSTPETGEATGNGAPAGAAPDAAPATPFDPAAFVAGLNEGEQLALAVWFRNAFPLVFDPALNTAADLAAVRLTIGTGAQTRTFRAATRVKRGGRYYAPGADVPLTRKEHAALKSAGVVAEDWPD